MNTPDENGILLGEFANQKSITLKDETPQNKSWYRVYGQTINGSYIDGWCQGYYLETEVKFKEWHGSGNINVRLETKTNTDTNIIGKLPLKGRLRLLEDNYTKNTHT